jgi:hypothetical protein
VLKPVPVYAEWTGWFSVLPLGLRAWVQPPIAHELCICIVLLPGL